MDPIKWRPKIINQITKVNSCQPLANWMRMWRHWKGVGVNSGRSSGLPTRRQPLDRGPVLNSSSSLLFSSLLLSFYRPPFQPAPFHHFSSLFITFHQLCPLATCIRLQFSLVLLLLLPCLVRSLVSLSLSLSLSFAKYLNRFISSTNLSKSIL